MSLYALSMVLIIGANVTYHICQHSISTEINPLVSLAITYCIALVAIVALLCTTSGGRFPWQQFRRANWASYVLAIGVVGLEYGFLQAYRAGWHVKHAGLYSNIVAALLLVPIGILWFNERLTTRHIMGITLSIAGLALMTLG